MLAGGLFSAPLLCADLYDGWVGFYRRLGPCCSGLVVAPLCHWGDELVGCREAGNHTGVPLR